MFRALLIAQQDYLMSIKSKTFVLGLLLPPILIGGLIFSSIFHGRSDRTVRRIAIVDHTGVTAKYIIQAAAESRSTKVLDKLPIFRMAPRYEFEIMSPDEKPGLQRLALSSKIRSGELFAFIEVGASALQPADNTTASWVTFYTNSSGALAESGVHDILQWFEECVNTGLQRARLDALGINTSRASDILRTVHLHRMGLVMRNPRTGKIDEGHELSVLESIVPSLLVYLQAVIVLFSIATMLGGVAEDKMQRVFEMLMVSASPLEIMIGKVLSALARSLTSSIFYFACALFVLATMAQLGAVPIAVVPWFFVYLVLDVLILAAMGAALGAASSSPQQAQSLGSVLLLPVLMPVFATASVMRQPNGSLATALSLFPPFTPVLMLLRQALPGGVPTWQPWVGLGGVVVTAFALTWLAARIFRVGILLQGKAANLAELIRWARRA